MPKYKNTVNTLLDPALMVLDTGIDPELDYDKTQIRKAMGGLHECFQDVQIRMRDSIGQDEDELLESISKLITQATRLAITCDRNRETYIDQELYDDQTNSV